MTLLQPLAIDAAVSYMEKAAQTRVAVECKWYSVGIPPDSLSTYPSASDLKAIFQNHKSMVPEPQVAILQLYSTIDSTLALSQTGSQGMNVCSDALRRVSNVQHEFGCCRSVEAQHVLQAVRMTAEDISSIRLAGTGWETTLDKKLALLDDYKLQLEICRVREDLLGTVREIAPQYKLP
jgi:hypothetical protein